MCSQIKVNKHGHHLASPSDTSFVFAHSEPLLDSRRSKLRLSLSLVPRYILGTIEFDGTELVGLTTDDPIIKRASMTAGRTNTREISPTL